MEYIKELEKAIEYRIESIKDSKKYRDEVMKNQEISFQTLYKWEIEKIKEDAVINELYDLLTYMNDSFQ